MILCFICTYTLQMAAQTWIGTWATAPQTVVKAFMPYNNNMTNRSVRRIVKVSVGGDVIRLKLSNIYSMQPVVIRSIYIAHAKDSFKIDAKSAQYFKFGNSYKATIPAGRQIVSDALKFNLKNPERVAITINYTSAPRCAYRSHGLTYHLLYHEGSNQCPLQLRKGFPREPLVQHQRYRCVYDEHQHERHRHHGQLHHRRQMFYG